MAKEIKIPNVKIPPQILGSGIALIVILFVVYFLLKRIGIIKSKAQEKADIQRKQNVTALMTSDLFDPTLYKNSGAGSSVLVPESTLADWTKTLNEAFPYYHPVFGLLSFWTDEEKIFGVFRQISYQLNISQISDYYSQRYGLDLLAQLEDNLNESELSYLWTIINQKSFR